MPWVDLPLTTQQGEDVSPYASDAELVNLMLRPNPPGSRTPFHISHTPGLGADVSPNGSSGRIHGLTNNTEGWAFVMRGGIAYLESGIGWTTGGGGSSAYTDNELPYRIANASTHLVAVDSISAVAFDGVAPTTPSREGFVDVAYQDGLTIYADTDSNSIYVSALDDPTTIDALDFTTVDALAGNVLAVVSDHRELVAIKEFSLERYYNAGGSGFPFQRSSPGIAEVGAFRTTRGGVGNAARTVAKHGGVVYWPSPDFRVYALRGGVPSAISTPWIERYMSLNVPASLDMAPIGAVSVLDGTPCYMISGFSVGGSGQRTSAVCDLSTGLWHVRYTPLGEDSFITHIADRLPPDGGSSDSAYVALYDADNETSTLREMSFGNTNDSGAAGQTVRIMTMPQIAYGGQRVFMYELYLDMAKPSTSGTCTLQWSDDGGSTYSAGVTATVTNERVRWQRLGAFRQRILRFTFEINSKLAIMGVRARIEVGE